MLNSIEKCTELPNTSDALNHMIQELESNVTIKGLPQNIDSTNCGKSCANCHDLISPFLPEECAAE